MEFTATLRRPDPLGVGMKRREFIGLVGGAAAWPGVARGQQSGVPVVGYLVSGSANPFAEGAFERGLRAAGYVNGRNVSIEFRRSDGDSDQLSALAADLVSRRVSVIAAFGVTAAMAARTATGTIPIVFTIGVDPVKVGLVASLNLPGGNITGTTTLAAELGPKRLELLHELVPSAETIGLLQNPTKKTAEVEERTLQETAFNLGLKLFVVNASTDSDFETAFSTLTRRQIGALVIGPDGFFATRVVQLAALSVRHKVPTIFQFREFAEAGGLVSYGGNFSETSRQGGLYTGRILRGERPENLPVLQATKAELFINMKTARTLGITFPTALLVRADEVIE
jgi:putative tryptophan/tyrosine transport system substrate-binding protein